MNRWLGVTFAIHALLSGCGYPPLAAICPQGDCNDGGNGASCATSADCAAIPSSPVCDTANHGGTCVACDADHKDACSGMTPVCNVTAETCNACITDADCATGAATGVCLPSGACVSQDNIIHVAISGSLSLGCGTATDPCGLDSGLAAVSQAKNVVRIDEDGQYASGGLTLDKDVTIDARGVTTGAVFARTTSGPIFTIGGGRNVTLLGGTIQGAMGAGGDGINCDDSTITMLGTIAELSSESAIDAQNCMLTLTRVNLRNNNASGSLNAALKLEGGAIALAQSLITNNRGGGLNILADTTFTVVGNLFMGNGDPAGGVGGVAINTGAIRNRFEFNTVIENKAQATATAGVNCSADVEFIATSNIIWKNNSAVSGSIQVGGACPHAYSDVGPTALPGGGIDAGHNINQDPLFVNETIDAHPMHGSPVHDAAYPNADLTGIAAQDLDGHPRVAGAGGVGADLGAYIVP